MKIILVGILVITLSGCVSMNLSDKDIEDTWRWNNANFGPWQRDAFSPVQFPLPSMPQYFVEVEQK